VSVLRAVRVVRSVSGIHHLSDRQLPLKSLLLLVGALIPVAFTAVSIAVFTVNTPWWDEWAHVLWFEKLADDTLSLRDLFAQQNEYRQFFPNLVFVLLGSLTRGDFRFPIIASFLLACLVSFNIYRLAKPQPDSAPTHILAAYLLANILIFSPVQYENWMQGQQLVYFVPIACLSSCLVIAFSQTLGATTRWGLCALLCTISTFSSANGILCWLLVLPVLVKPLSLEGLRAGKWRIAAWLTAFVLSLLVYFHGYQHPSHHPAVSTVLTKPALAAVYFFTLLGGPLGVESWLAASIGGAVLLAIFGWACVQSWRRRRDQEQLARVIGWLITGGYSVLTALLITIGRAGFGLDQALAPRYTTFTVYLPLSLVFLIPICIDGRASDNGRQPRNLSIVRRMVLLAIVLIAIHVPLYLIGVTNMSNWQVRTLALKACVLLVNVVADDCEKWRPFPDVDTVRELGNVLERLGFLDARIVRRANVRDNALVAETTGAYYGSLTSLVHKGGDEYVATGEAILPHRGEPAHVVLLSYRRADGQDKVFAVTGTTMNRDVVSAVLGRGHYGDARWRKSFRSRELPAGPVLVTAWGFDAYSGRAYELRGSGTVNNDATTSRRAAP
jgi:hypothetical protein